MLGRTGLGQSERDRTGIPARVLCLLVGLLIYGCSEAPQGIVVARVGEATLTRSEVEARIPSQFLATITPEARKRVIEAWVQDELLFQEALGRKLNGDPVVRHRIQAATRDLLIAELLEREFEKAAQVSEEDIRAYYESDRDQFIRAQPQIRARHLLVKDKATMNRAQKRLRGGEHFDQVAREMSEDASAASGGDLGFFAEDQVHPAFWQACQDAKVGRRIVRVTPLGRHLIEVLDRREAGVPREINEVWGEIRQRIAADRRSAKRLELVAELLGRVPWSIIEEDEHAKE